MPTPTLEQSTQQLKYHLQQAAVIIDRLCLELDHQRRDYAHLEQEYDQLQQIFLRANAYLNVQVAAETKKVVDLPPFLKGGKR